jgi:N utilization substance protein B
MTRADTSDNAAATLSETSVRARRAARVAAVQALYQRDMNDISARSVIAEFGSYRLDETVDAELFGQLVAGVDENLTEIDGRISGALVEGWSLDRLETVLRAIFRAAVWELAYRWDIPSRVTISQYVEIAHAFFDGREPAMVNGLLDRVARELRAEEFDQSTPGDR